MKEIKEYIVTCLESVTMKFENLAVIEDEVKTLSEIPLSEMLNINVARVNLKRILESDVLTDFYCDLYLFLRISGLFTDLENKIYVLVDNPLFVYDNEEDMGEYLQLAMQKNPDKELAEIFIQQHRWYMAVLSLRLIATIYNERKEE